MLTKSLLKPLIWLLFMMPCLSFPASGMMEPYRINLNDSDFAVSTDIAIDLPDQEDFQVVISSLSHPHTSGADYFILKAAESHQGKKDTFVKVALNFPYKKRSAGGPYNLTDENRVIPGKLKNASIQESACPIVQQKSGLKICKKLSFVVIDDEFAIPETRYTGELSLQIITTGQNSDKQIKTITRKVYIVYEKQTSPYGIQSFNNDPVELNRGNAYKGERPFCVWSSIADRQSQFKVRLENKINLHAFELYDKQGHKVPYKAKVKFSGSPYQHAAPFTWIGVGSAEQAFDDSGCTKENLSVQVYAEISDVMKSRPGKYNGQLTVRVQAQ